MKKQIAAALLILLISATVSAQQENLTPVAVAAQLKKLQDEKQREEDELAKLLVRYTAEHVTVQEARRKIAELDKQIGELARTSRTLSIKSPEAVKLITEITLLRMRLNLCGYSNTGEGCADGSIGKKLAENYQMAARHPEVISYLLGEAVEKFDAPRGQTRSAAQVSQIADEQNAELIRLLVAQNQRIIELLEQLVKKK